MRSNSTDYSLEEVEKSEDDYNCDVFRELPLLETSLKFEIEDKKEVIHG